jgi:hypothetical protein
VNHRTSPAKCSSAFHPNPGADARHGISIVNLYL